MRRFGRFVGTVLTLALVGSILATPAAAEREARTRRATHGIVRGHDGGGTLGKATSLGAPTQGRGPTALVAPTAPSIPSSSFGFDALGDLDGFFPADTTGALGDLFFVAATNARTAVYDRSGVERLAPTLLEDLHPDGAGVSHFDPRIVYDQYADTHVLVWLGQEDSLRSSLIFVAAIPDATASDVSTWCATSFPGDLVPSDPASWADYPAVGYSFDRVVISTNQFTFPSSQGRFMYAQLLSMPKSSLYDCTEPTPTPDVFAGTMTRDPNGAQAFTIQPAQTVGAAAGSQFLLSVQLAGGNSYLTVWRLKVSATGLKLKKGNVPIGRTKLPPPGTQGGGSLVDVDTYWDAGDERLVNAFYDSDRKALYAAHAIRRNLKPDALTGGYVEAVARWYEVMPTSRVKNSFLSRMGLIGSPEVDIGWPTVATDGAGNLFVTYNRASQPYGEFLSAWVAEVPPGSTTATQTLLTPGMALYDVVDGLERWGDFTAINRDPVAPDAVATFNQYANELGTWQQVVHVVTHA